MAHAKNRTMMLTSALLLAFSTVSTSAVQGENADWPHLRGPQCDGRTNAAGLFGEGAVGFELKWKAALGPAYSGIAVSGKHLVTFFSDDESDVLIALDAMDGSELWRHAVGETYRGHDGSEDGPVSSPILHGGVVYALGPNGDLVALNLEDGAAIWSKQLVEDFGSTAPDYGFTTTPVMADGVLVVQAGGNEGRSIAGLDPATGEVLWSLGDETTQYQSPVAMHLAGRLQVVVPDGKRLLGIAPADGTILWEHAFEGERDSVRSNMATAIDGNRFAISVSRTLAILEVSQAAIESGEEHAFEAKELLRCRDLGGGYTAPVAFDGHLYGLNNDFLTCVNSSTGKRVWKSRPPGGCGLILVNDRLLIFGAEGVAVIAKATPEGYEEEARLDALEHTGFIWPAFANGRLYVRNSAEIASLAVVSTAKGTPVAAGERTEASAGAFAKFVRAASSADDPQGQIDTFMASHEQFPILEDGQMHVVFRGDVEDVAVAGTMIPGGRPRAMEHIPNTDFYHQSFPIEDATRWEYRFQVNFEDWQTDPLNPRTVPGESEDMNSEVLTPGYEEATHFMEPNGSARGRIDEYEYASQLLEDKREVRVYLPFGYDEGDETYPLLVVHGGKDWIEKGLLVNTLDNLIGKSVAPTIAVFIEPAPQWWTEGGGSGTEAYVKMLAEEFLPDLLQRYRIAPDADQHAVMGAQYFGLTAALAAVMYPDAFGHVVAQSVSMRDVATDALLTRLEKGPHVDVDFYLDWNRYDDGNADRAYDHGADSARLAGALKAAGYSMTGGEVLDSHGWGSLRSRTDRILGTLFPVND